MLRMQINQLNFFLIKERIFRDKKLMTNSALGTESRQATIASYQLSLLIAKKGAAHTVGEEIILPAAKITSDALFSEKHTK